MRTGCIVCGGRWRRCKKRSHARSCERAPDIRLNEPLQTNCLAHRAKFCTTRAVPSGTSTYLACAARCTVRWGAKHTRSATAARIVTDELSKLVLFRNGRTDGLQLGSVGFRTPSHALSPSAMDHAGRTRRPQAQASSRCALHGSGAGAAGTTLARDARWALAGASHWASLSHRAGSTLLRLLERAAGRGRIGKMARLAATDDVCSPLGPRRAVGARCSPRRRSALVGCRARVWSASTRSRCG